MKKNKIILLLTSLILIISLSACDISFNIDGIDDEGLVTQEYPVTVGGVSINSQPTKIAIASPTIADVVLALDYDSSVVVVTPDCTQVEYTAVTKASTDDYAAYEAAGVQLVIATDLDSIAIETFKQVNIPVINISSATNRPDLERMYSEIGTILGGSTTGATHGVDTARDVFTTLDDIERIIPDSDTIQTGAVLLDATSASITGDMVGDEVIKSAGLTSIFEGTTGGTYTYAELNIADPNYIFCPVGVKDTIMATSELSDLTAVKEGKVYEIDTNQLLWEGRSLILGATTIAGIVYPQLNETNYEEPTVPDELEDGIDETLEEASALPDIEIPDNTDVLPSDESSDDTSSEESSDDTSSEESSDDTSSEESSDDTSSEESSDTSYAEEHANMGDYVGISFGTNDDRVKEMQERLIELGYLTGEADGAFGNGTKEALEEFQEQVDLEVTGEADPNTLAYLYDN